MRSAKGWHFVIANLLTGDHCDAMTLDWSKLRYQHTAAVRTALIQNLAPTTVNKMLVALRSVLKEAYRLDLMDGNDYIKAADLQNYRVTPSLRGRRLSFTDTTKRYDKRSEARKFEAVKKLKF